MCNFSVIVILYATQFEVTVAADSHETSSSGSDWVAADKLSWTLIPAQSLNRKSDMAWRPIVLETSWMKLNQLQWIQTWEGFRLLERKAGSGHSRDTAYSVSGCVMSLVITLVRPEGPKPADWLKRRGPESTEGGLVREISLGGRSRWVGPIIYQKQSVKYA